MFVAAFKAIAVGHILNGVTFRHGNFNCGGTQAGVRKKHFGAAISYTSKEGKLLYTKTIRTDTNLIDGPALSDWNAMVAGLNEAYFTPVTFVKQ